MTHLKIVFYYETPLKNPTQDQAEMLAENYIAQMVLSGEDLLRLFEVEVVEEKK